MGRVVVGVKQKGSGQRFADDAETLMLLATSHYEPGEQGYARLLERVRREIERDR